MNNIFHSKSISSKLDLVFTRNMRRKPLYVHLHYYLFVFSQLELHGISKPQLMVATTTRNSTHPSLFNTLNLHT